MNGAAARSWEDALFETGSRQLASLADPVRRADPRGRLSEQNLLLCAGLGQLSVVCYEALGGQGRAAEVERAGALLSLLTKIDDQEIDSLGFHGGHEADRAALRKKTRARLAPTLASILRGEPAGPEPRCDLGAELGRSLRALALSRGRLGALLDAIAFGWEVQVEAVAILSDHPGRRPLADVERVTAAISGAWLLLIALVGAVPPEASRGLSPGEYAAFFAWGGWVQRADALADLGKDTRDGLLSSLPGRLLFDLDPDGYLGACARGDPQALYALVRAHRVDRQCMPPPAARRALFADLAGLGEVASLLAWVQGFLAWRFARSPHGRGAADLAPGHRPLGLLYPAGDGEAPPLCSAR